MKMKSITDNVVKYNDELFIKCKWGDCNQLFPNYTRLHVHLMRCHIKYATHICLWNDCQMNTLQDHLQLLRHALLHAFFEDCIVNTNKLLKSHHETWSFVCSGPSYQKPAYRQRSIDTFLSNPVILQEGFRCQWKDCHYVTDVAVLYVDHVFQHDYSDKHSDDDNDDDDSDDERHEDSSQLICLWQSLDNDKRNNSTQLNTCNFVCNRRPVLRHHVRRHTGLPNYICSSCLTCFTEFANFKEHFIWSLLGDQQNAIRYNEPGNEDNHCPIELKIIEESKYFPKHLVGIALFRCPTCIRAFITKECWSTHKNGCPKSKNKMKITDTTTSTSNNNNTNTTTDEVINPKPSKNNAVINPRKRVSQPYYKTVVNTTDYLYCCQVGNCTYKSSKLTGYRCHYRRYHLSSNPDGLWYSCHICTAYKAARYHNGTSGPLAPDLDEIIGDSDEESQSNEEVLTSAELLERLYQIWQNEKIAPVLLTAHSDLLGLIQTEVNQLESEAKSLPAGDLKAQMKRIQVERIRFIIADYMRVRIKKIERFAEHVLAEERSRNPNDPPHLTVEEYLFAKSYANSIRDYLKNNIINRLPANMQSVKDEELAYHPNPNSYVFCRSLKKIDYIEAFDYNTDGSQTSVSLTLEPGAQHLLPYSCIRPYVESGDVILI
uniref:DNA replication complex GINS protein SLD5 n=1 Tax=Trichobilharzia regenti TaxID=157069 RepID=A0AA85IR81_TRIRE|nr:unnamed protein product [Trichobilharzia regenti]